MVIITILEGVFYRLIQSIIILPALSASLIIGRIMTHPVWYWRGVLRGITPVLLWLNRVSVQYSDYNKQAVFQGVTDGIFHCVSLADILILNRLIPPTVYAYYPPIKCPWWLVIIFEKSGYLPIALADTSTDTAYMIGVVPPRFQLNNQWPETVPDWLSQPCRKTVIIQTTTDTTTDYRSLWTNWRKQVVQVSIRAHAWPKIINTRNRDRSMMRWLASSWETQ